MGTKRRIYEQLTFIMTFLIAVPLEAVTVGPSLCPTNKIAPHRRQITNWDSGKARTFGAFYDLLAPNRLQYDDAPSAPNIQNDLQEQPQEDDPDDCGQIEDYDENDLSSITPQGQRREGTRDHRAFFRPPQYRPPSTNGPQRPTNYPASRPPYPNYSTNRPPFPNYPTNRPPFPNYPPTRPPYWSGGFFGTNDYRPPLQQYPSDNIKPIHESSEDFQEPYNPSLVGGPSGQIVGVSPVRPTTNDFEATTTRPFFPNRTPRNYPERSTLRPYHQNRTPPSSMYPSRRPERPRNINNSGIFGSFVDLLFK